MPELTALQIANACGGTLEGDAATVITAASTVEQAGSHEIAFVAGTKYFAAAAESQAGCLLVAHDYPQSGRTLVRVDQPRECFALVLRLLYPLTEPSSYRHPTAIVHESAAIAHNVYIDAFATIGAGAMIGENCIIGPHSAVGECVRLGAGSRLGPRVTLYPGVTIGARAILHAGCVIGAEGFGFAFNKAEGRYERFPQVGTVVIGDDVEVGANSCIDRAALGITSIGDGSKLDNLVHVGHNCQVGKHVVMAAQCGLSGGVTVGDYALLGGQVGIADKAQIASRAVLGAQCGVLPSKKVAAGEPQWGTPARPLKQHLKALANLNKLPEYEKRLKRLEEER